LPIVTDMMETSKTVKRTEEGSLLMVKLVLSTLVSGITISNTEKALNNVQMDPSLTASTRMERSQETEPLP
jgi:hypothetical protein